MRGTGHYKDLPSTVIPTLKKVFQALALVAYGIFLSTWFSERSFLWPEFMEYGFLKKCWFSYWGMCLL